MIEFRSQLINQLSQISCNENHEFLTLFSDSHETTIFMNDFESILIFVIDIDIVAQLSYLRKFIDEYNQCKVRTRRIHLI